MTNVGAKIEALYGLFGYRLRAARIRKGLTVAELARRLTPPRSQASVSNIELGQQRIPLHLAAELAGLVGADLAEMVKPSAKLAAWEALPDE